MRRLKRLNLMLLCLLLTSFYMLQAQGEKNNEPLPEIKYNSLQDKIPSEYKIQTGLLDNGMAYYIRENKKPENRAELWLVIKAGSVLEDDDQQGLAHFIEHMCFNGSDHFKKNDLISFLEKTGMRFGADVNANTSFERTLYMIEIPMDSAGFLDKGLQVMEDWAHGVTFDSIEVEKERGVIMSEWLTHQGANDRVMRVHYPQIFFNSKFANRLPIGDTTIIQTAPKSRFISFYKQWYRPTSMAIIAIGDFKADKMLNKIQHTFMDFKNPPVSLAQPDYLLPNHDKPIVSLAKDKELFKPQVMLYYKHDKWDESTYEGYRKGIINNLISGMLSLRLQEISQKPNAPFAQAGAGDNNFISNKRTFVGVAVLKANSIEKGYEALLTELFRAKKHGFIESEFTRVKKEMMRNLQESYDERDKQESRNYAMEYVRNFTDGESTPGIAYELALSTKFFSEITLEEVNKTMSSLIHSDNLVITMSAPDNAKIVVPDEDKLLSLYNEVSKRNIEPYKDEFANKPLMKETPKPGKITSRKQLKELDMTELVLSNGAKVYYKNTNFKNDEIVMNAYSFGGTSLVPDSLFISANLADNLINKYGAGEFNNITLEKYLAGKEVSLSTSISDVSQEFEGECSAKDLESMLQILYLKANGTPEDKEAYNTVFTQMKETVKDKDRNPESALRDTLNAVMGNYNFRSLPLTEERLNQFSSEYSYKFFKDRFSDFSNFTFIFVGNIEENKFISLIETYIASLPTQNKKETWKDDGVTFPKGKVERELKKGVGVKSTVALVISGDFENTRQNRFNLQSMVELLRIRLREEIREEKGAVYGIGVHPIIEKYPKSIYKIFIQWNSKPERVEEIISKIKDVIVELKSLPCSKDNLQKIKEVQKREYETNLKENSFWVSSFKYYLMNNEDPKFILEKNKLIDKLTTKDIIDASKKYLILDNFAKFVLNPEASDKK